MRSIPPWVFLLASGSVALGLYAGCGKDESTTPAGGATPPAEAGAGYRGLEPAGQACTSAAQCYVGYDAGDAGGDAGGQLAVRGTIYCETKVQNGYCTHECTADTDCCAVPGECRTSVKQVCSPFTNTSTPKYCFLSCEDGDIRAAVAANLDAGGWDGASLDGGAPFDPNAYCYYFASNQAECRSSGGGSQNRKVCVPKF